MRWVDTIWRLWSFLEIRIARLKDFAVVQTEATNRSSGGGRVALDEVLLYFSNIRNVYLPSWAGLIDHRLRPVGRTLHGLSGHYRPTEMRASQAYIASHGIPFLIRRSSRRKRAVQSMPPIPVQRETPFDAPDARDGRPVR